MEPALVAARTLLRYRDQQVQQGQQAAQHAQQAAQQHHPTGAGGMGALDVQEAECHSRLAGDW